MRTLSVDETSLAMSTSGRAGFAGAAVCNDRSTRWKAKATAMSRRLRVALTLLVTALCAAYVLWKIDVGRTLELLVDINLGWFAAAVAVMVVTTWPMAKRWQWLLDAKGIHERLSWLTRAYFVSYAFSQVLPTGIGGDASRIYETARRHPGNTGTIAGSVILERALGEVPLLVGAELVVGPRRELEARLHAE
jgi:uncharacterized membrane protein YbhN (UPF0104 family)